MLKVVESVQKVDDLKTGLSLMFGPSVQWMTSNAILDFLMRCVLWWAKNDMLVCFQDWLEEYWFSILSGGWGVDNCNHV